LCNAIKSNDENAIPIPLHPKSHYVSTTIADRNRYIQ